MKKEKTLYNYEEYLTDSEILSYATILNKFKKKEIDYLTLQKMFLEYGITIEPVFYNIFQKMMNISEVQKVKERFSKEKYNYNEINCLILNSKDFKNIAFCLDHKAIEVLAGNGFTEYQNLLINILKEQLKRTNDNNEEISNKRSKWQRQINELETLLIENNTKSSNK